MSDREVEALARELEQQWDGRECWSEWTEDAHDRFRAQARFCLARFTPRPPEPTPGDVENALNMLEGYAHNGYPAKFREIADAADLLRARFTPRQAEAQRFCIKPVAPDRVCGLPMANGVCRECDAPRSPLLEAVAAAEVTLPRIDNEFGARDKMRQHLATIRAEYASLVSLNDGLHSQFGGAEAARLQRGAEGCRGVGVCQACGDVLECGRGES